MSELDKPPKCPRCGNETGLWIRLVESGPGEQLSSTHALETRAIGWKCYQCGWKAEVSDE